MKNPLKNHSVKNSRIHNEQGMAALLSVIILSMIMVSTLTSIYIYIENRARFQARLRMNYQTSYMMDDLGRQIAQAYQLKQLGTCPSQTAEEWLDCTKVCAQNTSVLPGIVPIGTPAYAVCVRSDSLNKIINGADYLCAYNEDGGATYPPYCNYLSKNNNGPDLSTGALVAMTNHSNAYDTEIGRAVGHKIDQWYSRLDHFFDTTIVKNAPVVADKMYTVLESEIKPPTVLGWLLPERAYAASDCNLNPEDPSCAQQCSANPNHPFCNNISSVVTLAQIDNGCSTGSTNPQCKKCAGTERRDGSCLKISICPPWISTHECLTSNKKIQQMLLIK